MKQYVCIKKITMGSGRKYNLGDMWAGPEEPQDNKGNSLVDLSSKELEKGHTAAFELVKSPNKRREKESK